MSDALAIAAVTATLKDVITRSATSTVSGASVVIGRPKPGTDSEHRVFIYLYHVAPNASLRNDDLPTRSGDAVRTRPKAALVLRYLFAFEGSDTDLVPERMLGAVVRDLHARPVLSRDDIANAIAARSALANADLPQAIERIRLTPLDLSLEEQSKLWSVFFQTPHAVSIAYEASVIVIDALEAARSPLPVLFRGENDRGVILHVGSPPALHSIHIGDPGDPSDGIMPTSYPSATLGRRLIISGDRLAGRPVTIRFQHTRLDVTNMLLVEPDHVERSRLILALPDIGSAAAWPAGVYDVTAIIGDSAIELPRISNSIPLALAPSIQSIDEAPTITPDTNRTATITIQCVPDVREQQRAVLVVGGREVEAEPRSASTPTLTFTVRNAVAVAATRLVLRVDNVENMPFRRIAAAPGLEFIPEHVVAIL